MPWAGGISYEKRVSPAGSCRAFPHLGWHVDHAEDLDFSGSSRGRRGISELGEHDSTSSAVQAPKLDESTQLVPYNLHCAARRARKQVYGRVFNLTTNHTVPDSMAGMLLGILGVRPRAAIEPGFPLLR